MILARGGETLPPMSIGRRMKRVGYVFLEGRAANLQVVVILDDHPQARLHLRDIDEAELLQVLALPKSSHKSGRKAGRFEVAGTIDRRNLRVVYKWVAEYAIEIITGILGIEMLSQIQINRRLDTAYIALRLDLPPGSIARSDRVHDDLILDYDAAGQLVGIELLDASQYMDLNKISQQSGDLLWGVAEAAAFARVKRPNFVRDYANKSDFPKPVVELASGRLWLSKDITDYVRTKKGLQAVIVLDEQKDSLEVRKSKKPSGSKVSSGTTQRSTIARGHRVSSGNPKK